MNLNHLFQKIPIKGVFIGLVSLAIVAGSVMAATRMAASKKPPARKERKQARMAVAVIPVQKQDVCLTVSGYGQADPVRMAVISPEVSGRVAEKHAALDPGGQVEKGEVLFKIDPVDYETDAKKARIKVKLQENEISQLKVSQSLDQGRLEAVRKNTLLAKAEFLRLQSLYKKDRVGTLSNVESAEQSYNSLLDTEKTLLKSLDLYPLQIAEAENNLADARSDLETARLNVSRCTVRAPFSGRVREADIETGTYVSIGTAALTLADDTLLEIQVPLSDRDAFESLGLRRSAGRELEQHGPFSGLDQIDCRVTSVTGSVRADLPARIHRAVKYDSDSRTLYLAVRVAPYGAGTSGSVIPLMDGMFCQVQFKGPAVADAVKIPASALNSDNTVYLARQARLKTLSVTTVMEDGDTLYVSGAFEPADQVITTVLSSPVENTSLSISAQGSGAGQMAGARPEDSHQNGVEEI